MSKMLINRQVTEYSTKIPSTFFKKYKVIVEFVKNETYTTINILLSNGISSEKFSEAYLYEIGDWDFSLDWYNYYGETSQINHIIESESFDKDMDDVVFLLTQNVQFELLSQELSNISSILQKKWLNLNFRQEREWQNLIFDIFNIDIPTRGIKFYFEDRDTNYEFYDLNMTQEKINLEISSLKKNDYSVFEKWLKWISLN